MAATPAAAPNPHPEITPVLDNEQSSPPKESVPPDSSGLHLLADDEHAFLTLYREATAEARVKAANVLQSQAISASVEAQTEVSLDQRRTIAEIDRLEAQPIATRELWAACCCVVVQQL